MPLCIVLRQPSRKRHGFSIPFAVNLCSFCIVFGCGVLDLGGDRLTERLATRLPHSLRQEGQVEPCLRHRKADRLRLALAPSGWGVIGQSGRDPKG